MKTITFLHKGIIVMLLTSICLLLSLTILSQKNKYFSSNYWQRYPGLKQIYLDSQYVNKHPKGWIPDEAVNAYAGGAYVKGVEPQLIAPDTPPLGRYFIGLSALIFNNENIVILFFTGLTIWGIYLLGKQIYNTTILTLIVIMFILSEPLFLNQLVFIPLLDIMQCCYLLFSLYFFNKAEGSKRWVVYYFLSLAFVGLFISTKFFITGVIIIGACSLVLFSRKQYAKLATYILLSPSSFLILLITYSSALFSGYSLRAFLGIQKWVFLYHKSQLILPFSIWPLLLFNRWYVWFGNTPIIQDAQWRITWPIITIGSLLTGLVYIFGKIPKSKSFEILLAWSFLYILFFSFGQVSSRYLVIYIPILYLICGYGIKIFLMKLGQKNPNFGYFIGLPTDSLKKKIKSSKGEV